MPWIRTFLDSGVLITAARSRGSDQQAALSVLADPSRVFLATPLLALEVVPKATFHKQKLELFFYERYLASAAMYRGLNRIEQVARVEAAQSGTRQDSKLERLEKPLPNKLKHIPHARGICFSLFECSSKPPDLAQPNSSASGVRRLDASSAPHACEKCGLPLKRPSTDTTGRG